MQCTLLITYVSVLILSPPPLPLCNIRNITQPIYFRDRPRPSASVMQRNGMIHLSGSERGCSVHAFRYSAQRKKRNNGMGALLLFFQADLRARRGVRLAGPSICVGLRAALQHMAKKLRSFSSNFAMCTGYTLNVETE